MKLLKTKYGKIPGYQNLEKYASGNPASLIFTEPIKIETPVGVIVPQYSVDDHGRRLLKPVYFYDNGNIKKAPLQEAADIETKYGKISAEFVMFYDDELLKKLFPLNGKLSGYWGEKDEYALAEDLELQLPCGTIKAKIINIVFYKNGNIKSITLWSQETVEAKTPLGTMRIRIGISFYEDGSVKSVEPAEPYTVETKIGKISAYDNDPEGIMGDINSLQFNNQGEVTALSTTKNAIILRNEAGGEIRYSPSKKESLCSENVAVTIPLQIEFTDETVRFNHNASEEYHLSECSFEIIEYGKNTANPFYICNCN
jgi:antitoxin component YwqK of YwqJK toxin-antitoxin module